METEQGHPRNSERDTCNRTIFEWKLHVALGAMNYMILVIVQSLNGN